MHHVYKVHPVDCQPQWDNTPQPTRRQWGSGLLAVGVRVLGILVLADFLYVAYLLLGAGS